MAGGFYDIAQFTFVWLQVHEACPACRTLVVASESRTLEVANESRTLEVDNEDRVLQVSC